MDDLLLGTSGYDYPEWRGVFYPADLKRKDFLPYYSTVFNALELNFSFYRLPTAERLLSFYERIEGRLSFSVKANRLLTHEISGGWQVVANDFKAALNPLLQKDCLCAVLFQFPQSFHYTDGNRIYLARLISEFEGFPVVIEFRHLEWIRQSVFAGLEERGASLVFCDMPKLKNLPTGDFSGEGTRLDTSPFVGKTAYIRLHGRNKEAWYAKESIQNPEDKNGSGRYRYRYDYSDAELCEFVPVVQRALMEGKRTAVFFNNHPDGSGAKNARRLREMILEGSPENIKMCKIPPKICLKMCKTKQNSLYFCVKIP